ncbi:P-loop NTPase [Candidatus Woesearchaeota archaeon]|nr:P-loop NTPase [Candidatus Woesearchaeota archaeon]
MSKTIGILSGKGGTGKTTLAINLAAALHNLGENTLLVDANLDNPHVGTSLGTGHYLHTVHDVLLDRIAATQAVHYHDSGLKIVPGSVTPKRGLAHEHLNKFSRLADYVLYDGPPGHHDHVLDAAQQVLIVTNPDHHSLADAHRLVNQAQDRQKTLVGVVLNKAGTGITEAQAETFLGVPIIASIPHDDKVPQALSRKVAYLQAYPKRPAAIAIKELAARIAVKPL